MAQRFLKAAGGNWSAAGTWSATGAAGVDSVGPPTAADDCIAELASGNLTIDGTSGSPSLCRSFDTTSGTSNWGGTLTAGSTAVFTAGDATAGAGNVALKLNSGITFVPALASTWNFVSTSATLQTISFGTKGAGAIVINGVAGVWALTVEVSCGSILITAGTLHFDGATDNAALSHTVTNGNVTTSGSGTKVLTLGNCTIAVSATNGNWSPNTGSGITINPGTATINLSGSGTSFASVAPSAKYGTVNFTGSGAATITNSVTALTFDTLTRTSTAAKSDTFVINAAHTIVTALTLTGNSRINQLLATSGTLGTRVTLTTTGATVTATKTDFRDFGLSVTKDLSAQVDIGDCGGNGGITFPAATTQNATVAGTKNWSDVTIWTSRIPLPQDDVTFTAWSSGTLTADMPRLGKNINFSGATAGRTLSINSTPNTIYGSLTLTNVTTLTTGQTPVFEGRGPFTLNSNANNFASLTVSMVGGTLTATTNAPVATGTVTLNNGTLAGAALGVTAATFSLSNSNTRAVTGTANWTATGTGTVWNAATFAGLTATGLTGNILITDTSSTGKTFAGGGASYGGTLALSGGASSGTVTITGSNTFSNLFKVTGGVKTILVTPGTTQTFTGGTGFGNGTNIVTINTGGAAATFTDPSGATISADYLNLTSIVATQANKWYAGTHSTDGGGNTNWIFTAPPVATTKMRKTLSPIGTRTGTRQLQGT